MNDHLDFEKIVQEHRGAFHDLKFKFDSTSLTFKNRSTSKTEKIDSSNIENLYWFKRARGYCLNMLTEEGQSYKFDGFQDSDFQKIDDFTSKYFKKHVEKKDMSVKGWNWGKPKFQGETMIFEQEGKPAFDIPLKNISNTSVTKNEAVLQFNQNDDASVNLMEIRFHVPTSAAFGSDNDNTEIEPAQDFIQKVLEKADIQTASEADAICTLSELNCITPRGRYDVKFFTDFVDFHGKTFDYKISYDHILRLFLLPHKDGRQMYFVIAMDPPMKQGNTRYPFLIVLFNIEENITVDLTVSEKTKEKFGDRMDRLENPMSGPYHEVVSRICRTVLDKKITVPGNFTTASGAKCYPCSCKANSGFLYPLERGFMFVNKPTLHILFSDIKCVKFDRSSQGTRSFDFEIEHKNGSVKHVFNGIEKTEQERLGEFIKQKGINIAKSSKSVQKTLAQAGNDSDDDHDAYAERMKAEGKNKDDDDDDDDDEEDEDFEAEESSDDDIEYDSEASIDSNTSESGNDSDDNKKSKKSAKSPKKKSKDKSPVKRKEKSSPSGDKAKKSKSSKPKNTPEKAPKSAEFIEDSGSDSD